MILLTKELNDILDTEGFPELTVRRNDDGFLNLVGRKCGKPILTFDTMSISKKLTAAERKILRDDYIIPVITTYKTELLTLIKELKDTTVEDNITKLLSDVEKAEFKLESTSSYSYRENKSMPGSITIKSTDDYNTNINALYNITTKKWSVQLSEDDKGTLAECKATIVASAADLNYCETKVYEYETLLNERKLKTERLKEAQSDMVEKCSL